MDLICIVCPKGCRLSVTDQLEVSGNTCPKGEVYAQKEVTAPTRVVTSTVFIANGLHRRLPVKTDGDIPKNLIDDCMSAINSIKIFAPVKMNAILIENLLDTGVNLVATRDMEKLS
ncbi:MAG: molybdopterin oxidoreductase [Candidatus Epulonipiscioides saccharophilum]|nr:MAG: molybdopterin oxidoreductase [Epulopiscium sp. AS2M-Bin001]